MTASVVFGLNAAFLSICVSSAGGWCKLVHRSTKPPEKARHPMGKGLPNIHRNGCNLLVTFFFLSFRSVRTNRAPPGSKRPILLFHCLLLKSSLKATAKAKAKAKENG
jgi:hypothetical protein